MNESPLVLSGRIGGAWPLRFNGLGGKAGLAEATATGLLDTTILGLGGTGGGAGDLLQFNCFDDSRKGGLAAGTGGGEVAMRYLLATEAD